MNPDIHNIMPTHDLIKHIESPNCPCNPRVEENGYLIIHNSWDGRELSEVDSNLPEIRTPQIKIQALASEYVAMAGQWSGYGPDPISALESLLERYGGQVQEFTEVSL